MSDSKRRIGRLSQVAIDKEEQGHDVSAVTPLLRTSEPTPESLEQITLALQQTPLRDDWEFVEPNDLEAIRTQSAEPRFPPTRPRLSAASVADKVRAGFLGSVCGCVLGKPVEFDPTLAELRQALTNIGEWPLNDYISERITTHGRLRQLHVDWPETVRERINWVAPDDDINYTLLGMLALERHGPELTKADIARLWIDSVPVGWTFGPERTMLARFATAALGNHEITVQDVDNFADRENPGDERCGAMIRADSYGYACPGDPLEASRLAWIDASLTHRRTGIYGSMFAAAAIAAAFVVEDPLELVEVALQFIPQRSRFHRAVSTCLVEVAAADTWLEGYERIHRLYGEYGHCRIYQETGTLINTLKFASNVGDGICIQVSQGNDTDSYGATAGALLGVRFGMDGLEQRWLEPFRDRLHTTVATLHEPSLSAVADRVAALPELMRSWNNDSPEQRSRPPTNWMG